MTAGRPWGIPYRFPDPDHRISRPLDDPQLRVLSLGAGLQSSTLAWMSARGDLPRVDFAVFADTGWEPKAVYDYLDWMSPQLPFPVIRVKRDGRDLGELSIAAAAGDVARSGSPLPPWFTAEPKGTLPKHCSKEFKARPVGRFIREQLGLAPRQHGPKTPVVEQWLGMTTERNGTDEGCRAHLYTQPLAVDRIRHDAAGLRHVADGTANQVAAEVVMRVLPLPPERSVARHARQSSR